MRECPIYRLKKEHMRFCTPKQTSFHNTSNAIRDQVLGKGWDLAHNVSDHIAGGGQVQLRVVVPPQLFDELDKAVDLIRNIANEREEDWVSSLLSVSRP